MVNEVLVNTYCQCSTPENLTIDVTNPKMILQNLTNAKIRYTWETVRDERIDNIQSVIEVRVYLPGHILFGRFVYKTADASDAHLYAINDAVKTIIYNTVEAEKPAPVSQPTPQPVPTVTTTPTQQPVTQTDILNMLQETGVVNTPITTAEQLNNDPREEVPFEDFALDANELDKLIGGGTPTSAPVQQPQNTVNGFTQEQIQAINNFKQQMGITDDAVLCNYINAWDNKLSKKTDLTPNNIDSFIEWTKSVGKSPC